MPRTATELWPVSAGLEAHGAVGTFLWRLLVLVVLPCAAASTEITVLSFGCTLLAIGAGAPAVGWLPSPAERSFSTHSH
ncbi:hypothetical protein [Streptomyces sp. NPDC014006]|uniref:hypothetical protein n=1 Tax=Streptomyces sp. NPDC014006 TaxID=3364870 RepID=UPI0036FEF713